MDFGEEWHLAAQSKPIDSRKSPDNQAEVDLAAGKIQDTNSLDDRSRKMVTPPKSHTETEEDLFKTINELYKNVIQHNGGNSIISNHSAHNLHNDPYSSSATGFNANHQNHQYVSGPNESLETQRNGKPRRRRRRTRSQRNSQSSEQYASSSGEETDGIADEEADERKPAEQNEKEKMTNSQEDLVSELKSILENVAFDWRNIKVDHNDKDKKSNHQKPVSNGNNYSASSESENEDDEEEEYWHFKIERQNGETATQPNSLYESEPKKPKKILEDPGFNWDEIEATSTSNENEDANGKDEKLDSNNDADETSSSSDDNDEDEEFYHFKIDPNYANPIVAETSSTVIEASANDVMVEAKKSKKILEDPGFDWTALAEESKDSASDTDTAASSNNPIVTFDSEANFDQKSNCGTTDIETISTDNDNDDEEFWHFEIENPKLSSVDELNKQLNCVHKSEESEATLLQEDDEENTYNEYDTITSNSNYRGVVRQKSVLEDEGFDWDFIEAETKQDEEEKDAVEKKQKEEINHKIANEEKESGISEGLYKSDTIIEEEEEEETKTKPVLPIKRNWSGEGGWWLEDDAEDENKDETQPEPNEEEATSIANTESESIDKEKVNEVDEVYITIPTRRSKKARTEDEDNQKDTEGEEEAISVPLKRNWTEEKPWWLDDSGNESATNESVESSMKNREAEAQIKDDNKDIEQQENEEEEVTVTIPIRRNWTENTAWWLDEESEDTGEEIAATSNLEQNDKTERIGISTDDQPVETEVRTQAQVKQRWKEEDKGWCLDDGKEIDKEEEESKKIAFTENTDVQNELGDMQNVSYSVPIRRNWTAEGAWWLDENSNETKIDTNIENGENVDHIVVNKNGSSKVKNNIEQRKQSINNWNDDTPWWADDSNATDTKDKIENKLDANNESTSKSFGKVKKNANEERSWWLDDDNDSSNRNYNDKLSDAQRQGDSEYEDFDEEWIYEEVSEEEATDESYDDSEVPPPPPPPPPPPSSGIPPPPPPPLAPPTDFEKKNLTEKQRQTLEKLKSRPRKRPDWSDMMKEVETGRKLRHVQCNDRSKPILTISKSVTKVDGQFVFETEKANVHNKLLKQIQSGVRLKPTKTNDRSRPVLEGLRKFRRQMTIEEQIQKSESKAVLNMAAVPDEVIEDSPDEMDDIDKLRDDLQSTKQMLALELRNKEAQERENKRLLAKIANLEAELANEKGNRSGGGSVGGSVSDGTGDVDIGDGKVNDSLVKQYKKDSEVARKETKQIEKKYNDTAEQLDVAKGQVEEQRRKIAELEKKLMQAVQGIIPSSSSSRRQSCAVGKESSPELELEEEESGEDETEEQKEERKARRLEREVKFLRAKLTKLVDKEMAAKKEKASIKDAMKKNQNFLKQETKKLKKLEKEVAKMAASMTLDEDEGNEDEEKEEPENVEEEETESEESESESEEETESESEESEDEDASNEAKKENLDPRVKKHEGRLTALKKTNFLLQTNVDRLQDEINLTREKSKSLQAELDAVVADFGF